MRIKLEALFRYLELLIVMATLLIAGNAHLELPKASVAACLAKQFDTISGRTHRSNAAKN